MMEADAEQRKITKTSELSEWAKELRLGCDHEFFGRGAGVETLARAGIRFREVTSYERSTIYGALRNREVDIIDGFSTDPEIESKYFRRIEDEEQELFGRYFGVFAIRKELVDNQPPGGVRDALMMLKGKISNRDMQGTVGQASRVSVDNIEAHIDAVRWIAEQFLNEKILRA